MKEVDANRQAWNLLAEDHYHHYKKRLETEETILNPVIIKELGDINGKKLIHLQCNTGADTICLARLGASITGVDLAPDNIKFARRLATDFGYTSARFIESDLMKLSEIHHEKYDVVFTSEGVLGWLPDLRKWAKTIRELLNDNGFFYINEIHPFFLMFDEEEFSQKKLVLKYPYFGARLDKDTTIGGYATKAKEATSYYWMYSLSEIIDSLIEAGLEIRFFHEFDSICYNPGNLMRVGESQYRHAWWKDKMPMQFSILATVRK